MELRKGPQDVIGAEEQIFVEERGQRETYSDKVVGRNARDSLQSLLLNARKFC